MASRRERASPFSPSSAATTEGRRITAAAALLYLGAYQLAFPSLDRLWIVPRLKAAVERHAECPGGPVVSAGFRAPSLVFLVGTGIGLGNSRQAADFLAGGPCRTALIERRREAGFLAHMTELGREAALLERVQGIDLNGGRALDIGVYRLAGARP